MRDAKNGVHSPPASRNSERSSSVTYHVPTIGVSSGTRFREAYHSPDLAGSHSALVYNRAKRLRVRLIKAA